MFRHLGKCVVQSVRSNLMPHTKTYNPIAVSALRYSSKKQESDEEFDARYEAYFNRPDIDEWEIRKAMNDLQGMDLVPEPKIIIAALKACRRLNDYALAVRFLEGVKVISESALMPLVRKSDGLSFPGQWHHESLSVKDCISFTRLVTKAFHLLLGP
ncbi:cytochrome c oxidase subunit 5A, mitochondrial [Trichonephila clavipes]|nr:cytochrome c oxidase subunit 5A, mitochondrial [Trichonephila clavipes]